MSKKVHKELRYRNAPEDIYEYVAKRAKAHNRSIPKELKTIIEEHQRLNIKK